MRTPRQLARRQIDNHVYHALVEVEETSIGPAFRALDLLVFELLIARWFLRYAASGIELVSSQAARFARRTLGHTKVGLANILGTGAHVVSTWERGTAPMSAEMAAAFASVVGAELHALRARCPALVGIQISRSLVSAYGDDAHPAPTEHPPIVRSSLSS